MQFPLEGSAGHLESAVVVAELCDVTRNPDGLDYESEKENHGDQLPIDMKQTHYQACQHQHRAGRKTQEVDPPQSRPRLVR